MADPILHVFIFLMFLYFWCFYIRANAMHRNKHINCFSEKGDSLCWLCSVSTINKHRKRGFFANCSCTDSCMTITLTRAYPFIALQINIIKWVALFSVIYCCKHTLFCPPWTKCSECFFLLCLTLCLSG